MKYIAYTNSMEKCNIPNHPIARLIFFVTAIHFCTYNYTITHTFQTTLINRLTGIENEKRKFSILVASVTIANELRGIKGKLLKLYSYM